jgi:type I restriction enzyme S subunit
VSEFPEKWAEARFGEVNSFAGRSVDPSANPSEHFELYSVPSFPTRRPELLLGGDIGSTKQTVQPQDVLVCKINPRINRVWQVMPRGAHRQIASSEWIVMRSPGLHADFLRHYFSSPGFRELICEGVTGVGGSLTRAQPKRVAEFPVPIAPLPEQKRIADKLDALLTRVDACRQRLDRVPDILKRFRQSVLAAAISGELTRDWREERGSSDARRTVVFDDDGIDVPASWDEASLADLLDPMRPLCYGVVQPGDASPEGPSLVRVQDLDGGSIALDDLRTISSAVDREYQRSRVRGGDVLISVVGTIGRVAIVPVGFEGNIARAIARLACGPRVLPEWTRYWLESHIVQWWLVRSSREVARKTLNLSELATTRVAVPSILEQAESVRRVGLLLAHATQLELRLASAQLLLRSTTPSTLTAAFRGDLVPQDPNDEPASKLLARLCNRPTSLGDTSKPNRGGTRGQRTKAKANTTMLTRKDVNPTHLTAILKERGSLTAEALWTASQLGIDDFYDQLKDEEARGLLRESRGGSPTAARVLEAAA